MKARSYSSSEVGPRSGRAQPVWCTSLSKLSWWPATSADLRWLGCKLPPAGQIMAKWPPEHGYGPFAGRRHGPRRRAQVLSATFTPSDSTDYTSVAVTTTLQVTFTQPCIAAKFAGSLKVPDGQALCIGAGGKVTGSVSVAPGGALWVAGGTIDGSLRSSGASALTLSQATVTGSVAVTGTIGPLAIGSGTSIGGSVSITSSSGAVALSGARVGGSLSISSNKGAVVLSGTAIIGSVSVTSNTAGVSITGNTVSGSLAVVSNSGPFVYSGNTVRGSAYVADNT